MSTDNIIVSLKSFTASSMLFNLISDMFDTLLYSYILLFLFSNPMDDVRIGLTDDLEVTEQAQSESPHSQI